jgi:hypothetical protein
MPDGDIVHDKLRRLYQKPYKWLCGGKATSDECTRSVLDSLKKDLIQKGDRPVNLCQEMANRLVQVTNGVKELESGDCAALSIEFDRLVQQSDGRADLKELALRASKSVLCDLRYGQEIDVINASSVMLERYINEVYEAEFKERIPLTSEHYAGVTQATLSERIEGIEPNIKVGIKKFVRDILNNQGISKISLPRRSSRKAIDLNEDLLAS